MSRDDLIKRLSTINNLESAFVTEALKEDQLIIARLKVQVPDMEEENINHIFAKLKEKALDKLRPLEPGMSEASYSQGEWTYNLRLIRNLEIATDRMVLREFKTVSNTKEAEVS